MKILIVGTGAVGGYFGGRLLQAGRDVTFFVRQERAAAFAGRGLRVRSPYGDFHIANPPIVTADSLHKATFDLALVSCKAPALADVMHGFAPAVSSTTAILPLLNGMRHLDQLAVRFGKSHVLGGVCMISAARDAEGTITHFTPMQQILFGECDGTRSTRVESIAATLSNVGFGVEATNNILQDMWDKWVFIAALAGVTCLMRGTIGDVEAAGGQNITLAILDEAANIAKAAGFPTREAPFAKYREMLTGSGSVLQASMLRDVENGAVTEADHVIGDLLERAAGFAVPAPMLHIANVHLKAYEARRLAFSMTPASF